MAESDRTLATFLPVAGAVVLVTASLLLPWYYFEFSSGTQVRDPDPASNETDVVRQEVLFYPYRAQGDTEAVTDPERTPGALGMLGHLVVAALAATALAALVDVVGGHRRASRWVELGLVATAILASVAALAWAWFVLPETVAHRGVEGFFTSRRVEDEGFIRTSPHVGWVLQGLAIVLMLAAMATKYAGGVIDVSEVEAIKRRQEAKR